MSLIINSGYKSLNLYFTPPSNAYNIDDDSTAGTDQLPDTSLRTDVDKLYVYISTTSGFTPSNDSTTGNLAYSGTFQSNLAINTIQKSPPFGYTGTLPYYEPLADNTAYYVRYAITSKLEPDLIVPQTGEQIAATLDISLEIQGSLTRDPMEIEADIAGNVTFPKLTDASYTNITAGATTTIVGTSFASYATGMPVKFPTITGITGISANTIYYIYDVTSTAFKIAKTYANAFSSIGITSTGTYTGGPQLATVLDAATNTYTGIFTVYKYSTNITTSNDLSFQILDGSGTAPNILPDSITGGVSISINNTNGSPDKGKYTVHGITSLVGTAIIRVRYTDPANTSRQIVLDKVLNIGKRRPGATASIVELVATPGMIFVEKANESGIAPDSIILSATPSAHVTNPIYKWYAQNNLGITTLVEFNNSAPNQLISSNFPQIKKTLNTNEIEVNKLFFSGLTPPQVKIFNVEVESVALNIIVQDTISLYYIKEGSDSIALGFTNENQVVSYDYNGDLLDLTTPIEAQLVVILGAVQVLPNSLPSSVQSIVFSVNSANVQGITWNSTWLTTSGALAGTIKIPRAITNFPSTFTSAQIPVTITLTFKNNSTPTVLTKILYINSSRDGRGGESYWLVNNPKLLIRQKNQQINVSTVTWIAKRSLSGVVNTYLTGYYKVFANGVLQTQETPTSDQLIPSNGKYWNQSGVITLRIDQLNTNSTVFTCQLYKDNGLTELLDEDDIQVYNEETEGILLFNDNTNHTFTLNITNQVSSYLGSGTYFSVQQGSEPFIVSLPTSNLSYSTSYNSTTGITTLTTASITLTSKRFYIKSIEFGPGINVNVTNWGNKITGQATENLNFLDWWNGASVTDKITLADGITQTYIKFTIEYKRIDGTLGLASSTQKISTTRDALAIIVDVENDTHNIPFNSSGSVVTGGYDYSGTIIQVFENGVELQYTNTIPTPVKCWRITGISNLGITSASIPTPTSAKYATVGNHRDMTANTATITYEIEACNSRGIIISGLKANQTFAKNFNTSVYNILGAKTLVKFFDGSYSTVTINAQKSESGNTQIFGYLEYIAKNGATIVATSSRALSTSGLIINLSSSLTVTSVIVNLYETATSTQILDTTELLVVPQGPRGQAYSNWFYLTSGPYTATEGDRIIADTRLGSFTIYLPPNPAKGSAITVSDGWDFTTYPLLVNGNGKIFLSQPAKTVLELDVRNTTYEIVYSGNTTEGWNFAATAGPKGDEGDAAKLIQLTASDTNFNFEDSTKVLPTTTTPITITATQQNISGIPTFTAQAYNILGSYIGDVTLNVSILPNIVQLTPTNFNTVSGISDRTIIRSVKITATIDTISDTITIYRFDNGGDAISHQMYNENHSLQANPKGVISSYSGATTQGRLFKGNVNETMNWTIGKTDNPTSGYTTTLISPSRVSTTGTIGSINTISGGWTATITSLSAGAVAQLAINDTISAIENSNGKLYGGSPNSVKITSINTSANTVTYSVIGGTSPIAGNIGGLGKGENYYTLTVNSLSDSINSATTTVTAIKDSQVSQKVFSLTKNKDGDFPITSDITNDHVNVETLNDGTGGNYSLATTIFTLLAGTDNLLAGDSKLTKIELVPSAGVTFNYTIRGNVSNGVIVSGTTSANFSSTATISLTPAPINLSIAIVDITKANDSGKVTIIATYNNVNYQQEFTVTKAKKGETGEPATIYEILADNEIIYKPDSNEFSPNIVTYTAYTQKGANPREEYKNTAGWIRLKYSANNSSYTNLTDYQLTTTSAARQLDTTTLDKTTRFIRAELWLGQPGLNTSKLVDWEVDNLTENAITPLIITVDIINDNHTIPFNAAGIGTYSFSGTDIRVYENSTELQYISSTGTLSNLQWKITGISGTNITPASIPSPTANKWATIGDHSAMNNDTATVKYTISVCNSKGTTFTDIIDSQTFSRVNGNAVYRIIGATTIGKNRDGTYSNITVNGQKNEGNTVTTPFGFLSQTIKIGNTLDTESSRIANSITTNPGSTGTATAVVVKLYETATSTTVLDQAEIKVINAGNDGQSIDIVFTRHTALPATNNSAKNPPDSPSGSGYVWTTTVPSGTNPLYASTGRSVTPTVTTSGWTWDTPVRVTGDIVVEVSCFKRSVLATESAPTGGSYNFTTKTLTAPADWSYTIPSGTNPLWESRAFVTDIAPSTISWSAPVRVSMSARSIDVSGLGAISYDPNTGIFTPSSLTLTALTSNLVGTTTYEWSTSSTGISFSSANASSTTVTITDSTSKSINLKVTDAIGDINKSITLAIVNTAINNVTIDYTNDVHIVPYISGTNTWDGSGGLIRVYDGTNALTLNSNTRTVNLPAANKKGYYNLNITKVSGNNLTIGAITGEDTTTATLAQWAGTLNTVTVYRITAAVRTAADRTLNISTDLTLTPTNSAISYSLSVSNAVSASNTAWVSNKINCSLYKIDGSSSTPQLYAGRFYIERLDTSNNYSGLYESQSDESILEFTLTTNNAEVATTKSFRVTAYLAGGFAKQIDQETVAVIKNGENGAPSKRTAYGYVFYSTAQNNSPGTPTATGYDVINNTFAGLSTGWDLNSPNMTVTGGNSTWWSSKFSAIENVAGSLSGISSGANLVFTAPAKAVGFTGVVTFTDLGGTAGEQTIIDGGKIKANTITLDNLKPGTSSTKEGRTFGLGIGTTVRINSTDYPSTAYFEINKGAVNAVSGAQTALSAVARGGADVVGSIHWVGNSGWAAGFFGHGISELFTNKYKTYAVLGTPGYSGEFRNTTISEDNNNPQSLAYLGGANECAVFDYRRDSATNTNICSRAVIGGINCAGEMYGFDKAYNFKVQNQVLLAPAVNSGINFAMQAIRFYANSTNVRNYIETGGETFSAYCESRNTSNVATSTIQLATGGWAAYLSLGTVGPFTGSHDALIDYSEVFQLGDIVIDVEVVAKNGINDVITKVRVANTTGDNRVVGVISSKTDKTVHMPAAMSKSYLVDGKKFTTIDPQYMEAYNTTQMIIINSLGEGQINVCGLGGDIQAGDYITSSTLPGKGMKQSDNLMHSYTVAKARESVTFSSPEEVKQIACIYHCG